MSDEESYPISFVQGDNFDLELEFREADEITPIDYSGHTFKGQLRRTATDPRVIAEFIFNTDAATGGNIKASLISDATKEIPVECNKTATKTPTLYSYDLESTSTGGSKDTFLSGVAFVYPGTTR
jgi:hypothetical protein